MAFIHGWKAFRVVRAHDSIHLEEDDGGHLHNTVSSKFELDFEGDEGYEIHPTLESAWQNTPAVYAHVTCLGDTILHEKGARCSQFSLDYFIEAWHVPELEKIATNLNVDILPANEGGCPVCRGDATEEEKLDWFGETYGK